MHVTLNGKLSTNSEGVFMPRANIVARSTVKPGRLAEAVELGSRVADLMVESGAASSRFWVPAISQDINLVTISSVCDSISSLDDVLTKFATQEEATPKEEWPVVLNSRFLMAELHAAQNSTTGKLRSTIMVSPQAGPASREAVSNWVDINKSSGANGSIAWGSYSGTAGQRIAIQTFYDSWAQMEETRNALQNNREMQAIFMGGLVQNIQSAVHRLAHEASR
jgi:hypothetical protein